MYVYSELFVHTCNRIKWLSVHCIRSCLTSTYNHKLSFKFIHKLIMIIMSSSSSSFWLFVCMYTIYITVSFTVEYIRINRSVYIKEEDMLSMQSSSSRHHGVIGNEMKRNIFEETAVLSPLCHCSAVYISALGIIEASITYLLMMVYAVCYHLRTRI